MTASPQQPPAQTGRGPYEPCEECGAPLDADQRYCVNCAARRGNGANPASRYFAAVSKRAHRPPPRPAAKAGSGSRAAAVGFFALLPIAVAIGVVVGRSGSGGSENEALLEALRKQQPAAISGGAATTTTASAKSHKGATGKHGTGAAKSGGKVLAHTSNGTVHEIAGYKPPKKKVEEDTKLVEDNPEQTGANYIKAQANLPDVTVVGGSPGSSPAAPGGAGEP
jgi:hypothetical protein